MSSRAPDATAGPAARPAFDVEAVRARFPLLRGTVRGRPLAYLDNASTTHKSEAVLAAMDAFYRADNANVHRAVHALGERATAAYEGARRRVARALGATDPREVVFVRGATEALNLLAHGLGATHLRPGDEVLVTALEHHANLVPWQVACAARGAVLRVAPLDARGDLDLEQWAALLSPRTRVVAAAHVSNALGTLLPVPELSRLAHERGAVLVVDGCQAVPHMAVDVHALGCDAYVLSGHKAYGPQGIGALWADAALLAALPPYQTGGEMIRSVSYERAEYADPPARFEAGTPHVAGAIGLAAALDELGALDRAAVAAHERALLEAACAGLAAIDGVRLVGVPRERVGVVSFAVAGAAPHEVAALLDQRGVAVRSGHHCAQPLMGALGVTGTVRASLALYNTAEDVERLLAGVREAAALLG